MGRKKSVRRNVALYVKMKHMPRLRVIMIPMYMLRKYQSTVAESSCQILLRKDQHHNMACTAQMIVLDILPTILLVIFLVGSRAFP